MLQLSRSYRSACLDMPPSCAVLHTDTVLVGSLVTAPSVKGFDHAFLPCVIEDASCVYHWCCLLSHTSDSQFLPEALKDCNAYRYRICELGKVVAALWRNSSH